VENQAFGWTLRCDEPFELRNPEGQTVELPYKKVEELLIALARSATLQPSRDHLAQELWPKAASEARLASLRQALRHLRRGIGDANVVSDRIRCGLSPDFRLSLNVAAAPSAKSESIMQAFTMLVRWTAINNPAQMLELLRSSGDLCGGLPSEDLLGAIRIARKRLPLNHPLVGWATFWMGCASLSTDLPKAVQGLKLAREHGATSGDFLLVASATFWEGTAHILQGRTEAGMRLADWGQSVVESRDGGRHLRAMESLRAHALLHQGQANEALARLEGLSGAAAQSDLQLAADEALRALYLATLGKLTAAREVLREPQRLQAETQHGRIGSVCRLTVGILEAAERPKQAPRILESTANALGDTDQVHLDLYAREALSLALWRNQEKGQALAQIKRCRTMRSRLKMAITGWDRVLLREVAAL